MRLALLVAVFALAACGVRGPPRPPRAPAPAIPQQSAPDAGPTGIETDVKSPLDESVP